MNWKLFKNVVDDDNDLIIEEGVVTSQIYSEEDKSSFNSDAASALYAYLKENLAEWDPKSITVDYFENDDSGLAMIRYSDSAVFKEGRHYSGSSKKVECGCLVVAFYAVKA
jgi:hypothetical protein